MTRHPLRQPTFPPDDDPCASFPAPRARRSGGDASRLHVCRCPKCNGPMVARHNNTGSYFHCRCFEKTK
jgi:hypothetical protein